MAQLHFLDGPLAGKRAKLHGERITIGRDRKNSIRIDDDSISPRHLTLRREGDDYFLQIHESRPPVAVNGRQVVEAKLHDGDKLQIGCVHVQYRSAAPAPVAQANPLDFWSETPADAPEQKDVLVRQCEVEIISMDDVDDLPPLHQRSRPTRSKKNRKIAVALLVLFAMLAGSTLLFRKDLWKNVAKPANGAGNQENVSDGAGDAWTGPGPPPPPGASGGLSVGIGPSGLKAEGEIRRTRNYKSHQEAVDAAQPGDSVIFDSTDADPVVVRKPLRDVQFISGGAAWELHADLVDCQFVLHELKKLDQQAGKLERCVFYRCPMKQTRLTHSDAVSFYCDEQTPLSPENNPDGGRTPILQLTGFVRDVTIHKPFAGSAATDKQFAMHWGPSIRILATDPEGDGRGSYILSPVVLGQRAWTPHQITRGNAVTYAHLTAEKGVWADPVLEIVRGNDCAVLCTSFGGETAAEQYASLAKKIKYRDHEEFGHDGPAFRGAAITIQGQRTRIVGHGDPRKPWTVGRRMGLPGFHYADGIVAVDPFVKEFATEHGGISLNLAEQLGVFIMRPGSEGAEFLSSRQQPDGSPAYPLDGPELHRPTLLPLKDLRLNAGEFDRMQLLDMTGKPAAEIEKALSADRSIFLGPGTYEFTQPLQAGFVAGAGIEQTILKWPEGVDCSQRSCRGLINCTVSGGRFGYNAQAGVRAVVRPPPPRPGRPARPRLPAPLDERRNAASPLFLRTRFAEQQEAGVNLQASLFQTWQDCEFAGCRVGFGQGLDKGLNALPPGPGPNIDNLNICNCTFRKIASRAIDLTPDSPNLGHVGIHNCRFEEIGETAIRIEGGQTHLVQLCQLSGCATKSDAPAISVVSNGALVLSHLSIDGRGAGENSVCVALKGRAAVSRCQIRAPGTALKCDGLLVADEVTAVEGNLETRPDSLLIRCRFKNMDLADGTALARDKEFADVTAVSFGMAIDKSPPPEVTGVSVKAIEGQRRLEWDAVGSSQSGVVQYIIYRGDREIGRTPFCYEQPSDGHTPLLKAPIACRFVDPNPDGAAYRVVAVNAAGLTSDGKSARLQRLGPARGRFVDKEEGELIVIKDFVIGKGKITHVVDAKGKKYPLAVVGNKGTPNEIVFEPGEIIDAP